MSLLKRFLTRTRPIKKLESTSPDELPKDFGKVVSCEEPSNFLHCKKGFPPNKNVVCADPIVKSVKKCEPVKKRSCKVKKKKVKAEAPKKKKTTKLSQKKQDVKKVAKYWMNARDFSTKYKFISVRWIAKIVSNPSFNQLFKVKLDGCWFFDSHYLVFFLCTRNEFLGSKKLLIQAAKKRKVVFRLMEDSLGKKLATTLCA